MIPFDRTLAYDHLMGDLYIPACPFCAQENVLLPLKPRELEDINSGSKKLLVFPCCRNKLTIVDSDSDYLLADRKIRRV